MKASELIYEKVNFVPVVCMLKGFKKSNLKKGQFSKPASKMEKQTKATNIVGKKKCLRMTKYLKKKIIYMFLEKYKYILVY